MNLLKETEDGLRNVLEKALEGKELSVDEGERLLKCSGAELEALVETADRLRRRMVGDTVTFVVNRNINFTNVCWSGCKFCAFHRPPGSPEAFTLTPKQVTEKTREAVERGATEVCMQGGLNPSLGLTYYIDLLRAVRSVSEDIHIHAYSPAEINHVTQKEGLEVEEVIKVFQEEGLDSVPGTAAEILVDRVRSIICPNKISTERWKHTIKACHRLGLPTTSTIMYGHVETPRDISMHLVKLREIQKETGGFTELVLLPLVGDNTVLKEEGRVKKTSPADHLRLHAAARLILTNYIENIQSSWVKLGPKLAQRTLNAGVNDLGGTLIEENITKAAGGQWGSKMEPRKIKQLIREVGRTPRERTTTYQLVK